MIFFFIGRKRDLEEAVESQGGVVVGRVEVFAPALPLLKEIAPDWVVITENGLRGVPPREAFLELKEVAGFGVAFLMDSREEEVPEEALVFYPPHRPGEIARALLGERRLGRTERGRVVVLVGAKGGVGTTFLAVNLAWVAASRLKLRGLLLDTGPRPSDLGLYLEGARGLGLNDFLQPEISLRQVARPTAPGLSVLPGSGEVEAEGPDPLLLRGALERAREEFEFVLVDLHWPPGEERFSQVAKEADELILVSTGDPASVRQARLLRDAFRKEELPPRLVLNRVSRRTSLPLGEVARLVGCRPEVLIPEAALLARRSTWGGKPAAELAPHSPFVRAVETLAFQLWPAPEKEYGEKWRRWRLWPSRA